jgi:WD40 repeat protein
MTADPLHTRPPLNHTRIQAYAYLIWVAASVFIVCVPLIGLVPFSKGGGGPMLFGAALTVLSSFYAWAKFRIAARIDAIRRGEGALARWTYTPEEWARYLAGSRLDEIPYSDRFRLVKLLVILAASLGILIFFPSLNSKILGVFMTLVSMTLLGAHFLYRAIRNANRTRFGEIIVTENGVLFNHEYIRWRGRFSELYSADSVRDPYPHIKVTYVMSRGYWGKNEFVVHIPIPGGREIEASRIVDRLDKRSRADAETSPTAADMPWTTRRPERELTPEEREEDKRRWRKRFLRAGLIVLAVLVIAFVWHALGYYLDQHGYEYGIADFSGEAHALTYSPDGRYLAALIVQEHRSTLMAWEAATGHRVLTCPYDNAGDGKLRFSEDGSLVSVTSSLQLDVRAFPSGAPVLQYGNYAGSAERDPRFSADHQYMATNAEGVSLWDLRSGKRLRTVSLSRDIPSSHFAFLASGELIILDPGRDTLTMILLTGISAARETIPWPSRIIDAGFISDRITGHPMLLISDETGMRLRSLASLLHPDGSTAPLVRGVAYAKGIQYLPRSSPPSFLMQNADGAVTRYRCTDGGSDASADLPASMHHASLIDASPDGARLLFWDYDDGVYLWTFAQPHDPVQLAHRESLIQFSTGVFCAAMSPDGRHYATGRHTIRVWQFP